jgi:xylulokinase
MSLYLGLDSSTQSLSAMVIDTDAGDVVLDISVNYERDLPAFPAEAGVLVQPDPLVKHSDPRMWVAALDLLLARGQEAGFDWGAIAAVSGSGQQHGSVYLRVDPSSIGDWDAGQPLAAQLGALLSRDTAPIWSRDRGADHGLASHRTLHRSPDPKILARGPGGLRRHPADTSRQFLHRHGALRR